MLGGKVSAVTLGSCSLTCLGFRPRSRRESGLCSWSCCGDPCVASASGTSIGCRTSTFEASSLACACRGTETCCKSASGCAEDCGPGHRESGCATFGCPCRRGDCRKASGFCDSSLGPSSRTEFYGPPGQTRSRAPGRRNGSGPASTWHLRHL